MYEAPIKIIESTIDSFSKAIIKQRDDAIFAEFQSSFGVDVDKAELIRALQYDRNQYEKGYADGEREAMDSIVRCKDCEHSRPTHWYSAMLKCCHKSHRNSQVPYEVPPEHFCSYGERREGE